MSVQVSVVEKAGSKGTKVEAIVDDGFDVRKFVENFEVLAEAEGGIGAFRRLVVDLAIRGGLTTPFAHEGTGADLVQAIQAKRKLAGLQGRAMQQDQGDADLASEPFHIPVNWSWSTMGEIAVKLGAGSTPLGGRAVYKAAGIKFLRSQNVWNDGLRLTDVAFIDRETHTKMSGTHIEPGDILLNITGASIGRTAVVPETFDDGNVSQHVAIVRLVDKAIRRFVHLAMTATYFQDVIMAVQVGVSREGLSMKKLQHLRVPLPPLAEQKRIVVRVDQLMALIDDLEAQQTKKQEVSARFTKASLEALTRAEEPRDFDTAWKRVVENFPTVIDRAEKVAELKRSILELAVRGALTAETGGDTLPNVVGETSFGGSSFPDPPNVAMGAPGAALREDHEGSSPKWQGVSYVDSADQGVLFVTSENVGGGQMLLDEPKYVEERFNEIEPRSILRQGDLLMNIVGASIGRAAIFDRPATANINQAVCLIRLEDGADVEPAFLLRFFNSPTCVGFMFDKQVDNARANLSMGNIARFLVPLPPRAEQRRIVAKVEHLMKLCDDLEAKLRRSEERASKLVEAVVQEMVA